ncbi:MAG: hypothetical protein RLZZ214_100 [Verrucomicrobiota bacterium]
MVLFAFNAELDGAPTITPAQIDQRGARPMLANNLDRNLRYTPEDGDFVIVNGDEFFNRPLYGGSSPFRVDAGDMPEFSFYLPGRGGNLRLGFATSAGTKWLHDAERVEARYRGGSMIYQVSDPLLGKGALRVTAFCPKDGEGVLIKVESAAASPLLELHVAFGGINGVRGGRDGDIGCERLPVREFFKFAAENSKGNEITVSGNRFVTRSEFGSMVGLLPKDAEIRAADAELWEDLTKLANAKVSSPVLPIAHATFKIPAGGSAVLGMQHLPLKQTGGKSGKEVLDVYREVSAQDAEPGKPSATNQWSADDLAERFDREQKALTEIAGRVSVKTPDPFINAAMPALVTAADGVWDDRIGAYLHGGVAWRTPLLGWRVAYAGDVFGWHDRTRAHFDRFAARQDKSPPDAAIPAAEPEAYLARNETALHSNGDMTQSHYDMNMVGVDTIFRHLLWTGDLEYARKIWPVIERHLAWERRMFRREFGPEKLPLYEAYACIWASDSLAYNGGGGTHSSAYNLYHNRVAARVAKLIGEDPSSYEKEAELIDRGMKEFLWLKDKGWFAEWKDLLGDQAAPQEAAAWTFYHTMDSEVPDPFSAWQMSRFVDTRLPHIPVRGPGVPEGYHTISTTTWMPWIWSLNNVVMGESAHTAHALWQAGKDDSAFKLFKGAILDSMYLGICPGNVGMCTWYDVNRRESQRDFGDGVGALSRAFMEGLFGITPDLLAGELKIRPGFPTDWNEASIHHPSFDVSFERKGETERFKVVSRFKKPVATRLIVTALRDDVAAVTANGSALEWKFVKDAVATPRIEIFAPAAAVQEIVIQWKGSSPAATPEEVKVKSGESVLINAGAPVSGINDPQAALSDIRIEAGKIAGKATGTLGHRTVFVRVSQGKLEWWQPLSVEIIEEAAAAPIVFTTDWSKRLPLSVKLDVVPLDSLFNATVGGIFKQDYVSPRSPHVSLALPRQGYGSWCHPKDSFEIDDSGIRKAAGDRNRILLPNGVPLSTPGDAEAKNIAFVSRWDNFPKEITVPLSGKASKVHLLMAGSTDGMKSRRDNGEIIITYTDGSITRVPLENPTTWWPIDQDYLIDDYAFRRPGPLPVRVDLMTGKIRVLDEKTFAGKGRSIRGGAATVLDLNLDPTKEVKSLTVRAIANEVVIGLMSATLQRP